MTLNPTDFTPQPPPPAPGTPERSAPPHPRFALEAQAARLKRNHPRMAEEICAEARRYAGLSARVAWERLQAEAVHIERRHLSGQGSADRNRWLAQLIRDLPEQPLSPFTFPATDSAGTPGPQ
ncbi:hypothetical protein [Deinococcus ficus]|uniref:Uncharacterized protein n=1 Tax=Deinococcus ficus TaxID=317577 RepID=A0A221T3L1_9DEIO|nr:hypothetical protein [Deinococcus ficus]ASN83456.1 hypothetical protein DFI_19860 [Deinococcus ficus]